jgi:hypothetical protein
MPDLWNGSFCHDSNVSAQLCQSDSDLSPSPGQPGYNTGMDFRTHFERIPGPTRRNDLREAVLPA